MCRPPNGDMTVFEKSCGKLLSTNDQTSRNIIFASVLEYEFSEKVQHLLISMFQYNVIPTMNKPTRVTRNTATATDRFS